MNPNDSHVSLVSGIVPGFKNKVFAKTLLQKSGALAQNHPESRSAVDPKLSWVVSGVVIVVAVVTPTDFSNVVHPDDAFVVRSAWTLGEFPLNNKRHVNNTSAPSSTSRALPWLLLEVQHPRIV